MTKLFKSADSIVLSEETHMGIIEQKFWQYIIIEMNMNCAYFISSSNNLEATDYKAQSQICGVAEVVGKCEYDLHLINQNTNTTLLVKILEIENKLYKVVQFNESGDRYVLGNFTLVCD